MIAISAFDLALGAIALTGYGCLIGYLAGARYGRARAELRSEARRARVYARMRPVLDSLGTQLGSVTTHMGATNKRLDSLEAKHGRAVIVDWNFLNAIANDAGYVLTRREQVH